MRRVGTDERHVGTVPLELFQDDEFKYQTYLRVATQIILQGLDELNVTEDEEVCICSGFILSQARETLREMGYNVKPAKITGVTQDLAEREFIKHLNRLGVGSCSQIKEMRSFNRFLSWVLEDLEDRERFVKTGWKRWPELKESRE
ncbi:MAG: hypothetical protein ACLFVP_02000 [Candidatus Bathyarchaeia archaeon]